MLQQGKLFSQTVPLYVEHNRPFVEVTYTASDGSTNMSRFLLDTGGGGFLITEFLAQQIGISPGESFENHEGIFAPFTPPAFAVGNMPLHLEQSKAYIALGTIFHRPGILALGFIPARVLANYRVIFHYPRKQFTLMTPEPAGQPAKTLIRWVNEGDVDPIPLPEKITLSIGIHPESKYPRTEVQINGQVYGMLLDTGASHTMMSRTLLEQLAEQHPDWPRAYGGAVGTANMGAKEIDTDVFMLRIPEIIWGPYHLKDISVFSRPEGIFEQYMSEMMTEPIIGALAGNVLTSFSVDINYQAQTVTLEQFGTSNPHDMDLVGLTILPPANPMKDVTYTIIGTASTTTPDIIEAIRADDKLIAIDGRELTQTPFHQVIDALRGEPGQTHTLLLERDGQRFEVVAPVTRII